MIHTIIVEDDPMVAQINRRYMEQFSNFHIDAVFGNGKVALDYLRQNTPDLIILDVYMPGMDGSTLLQRIRSENIKTSVIIVTAATEMTVIEAALRLGIVDYLIKPYTFLRFQEALNKFLKEMNLLKYNQVVNQEMVDRLMNHKITATHNALAKGLNAKTLENILAYLQNAPGNTHTCESLSAALSLSKVTARRYLNHLIDKSFINSSIDYETGGRPRILYHLK